MKIRTDFVTNSSSSSFCVEISLKSMDGTEYSAVISPDDGGGNGSANINCKAKDIANVSDVSALLRLLRDHLEIAERMQMWEIEDEGDEWEENDNEDVLYSLEQFENAVRVNIQDISQIRSIQLRRIWCAFGEYSSCFGLNLDIFADELLPLCQKVCETNGEASDMAKIELAEYLDNFSGAISAEGPGYFPTGFLGSRAKTSIEWRNVSEDIGKFARAVVDGALSGCGDYAIEATIIEMQNRSITQKAIYYLGENARTPIKEFPDPVDYASLTSPEAVKRYKAAKSKSAAKDREEREKRLEQLKALKVGDAFTFGAYPQNKKNKPEPIEWIVLDRADSRILVLSKYTLDEKYFHEEGKPMFWSDSLIRRWLNSDFLSDKVFTEAERDRICPTSITEKDRNGIEHTTTDGIFLLSESEVKQYFPLLESRITKGTPISRAYFGEWGLRSYKNQGLGANGLQYCSRKGRIITKRQDLPNGYINRTGGVRPAMWINVD